ncbi:hypothetical protein JTB14_025100 [Gonioctena quinquepunctata]|nr:hypothetical protein JTB14_025100 [Gonioctena quinquepunctata]
MLNSHIEKLSHKNKLFADEAVQREDELNDLIRSQQEIITESDMKINELQDIIYMLNNKPKQIASTQTAIDTTSKLTQTTVEINNSAVQTMDESKIPIEDLTQFDPSSESVSISTPKGKKSPKNGKNYKKRGVSDNKKEKAVKLKNRHEIGDERETYGTEQTAFDSTNVILHKENNQTTIKNSFTEISLPTKNILIIGDQYGVKFSSALGKKISSSNYKVEEILLPETELSDLTRNIFHDTLHYGSEDFVIIMIR